MKRFLFLALLANCTLSAAVVTGKITDLAGVVQASNRSVTFTLLNCGNNLPTVVGSLSLHLLPRQWFRMRPASWPGRS